MRKNVNSDVSKDSPIVGEKFGQNPYITDYRLICFSNHCKRHLTDHRQFENPFLPLKWSVEHYCGFDISFIIITVRTLKLFKSVVIDGQLTWESKTHWLLNSFCSSLHGNWHISKYKNVCRLWCVMTRVGSPRSDPETIKFAYWQQASLACMFCFRKKGRGRAKARKRGKGKRAPAIRAGVFVFRPQFSQLIRQRNCQYVTNQK